MSPYRQSPGRGAAAGALPSVLWWGRFDPDYSRNRILRGLLVELGWRVVDFHPRLSALADWEARLRRLPRPDLVWVPCFRQRDLAAARRWSRVRGVPLLFDPLISAYDKQVDERGKLSADSAAARRLLARERSQFQSADLVLADTPAHADYFADTLGVARERLYVVYVGAEEALFHPAPLAAKPPGEPFEVLFYGSFIPLQGPQVIAAAARLYQGPPVRWVLLGDGPLRSECERLAAGLSNVVFEDRLPYAQLPARIHRADFVLGVFGTTPKAGRVIPNKVYQAMACGRPVVTRRTAAYPRELQDQPGRGLIWVEAGDPLALARAVAELAADASRLAAHGDAAARAYMEAFSKRILQQQLQHAMNAVPGLSKQVPC